MKLASEKVARNVHQYEDEIARDGVLAEALSVRLGNRSGVLGDASGDRAHFEGALSFAAAPSIEMAQYEMRPVKAYFAKGR